jgi:tRNA-Thr(GGU) m(6)t(6)A37 methyltransferase TsaA
MGRITRLLRGDRREEPFALAPVTLLPIGVVRSRERRPERLKPESEAVVLIGPEHAAALAGLAAFSHLLVVTWLHLVSDEERALGSVHPAGDPALPRTGVLALRTHHRPNPLGVTVVRLERVEGTRLHVRGLDAVDGTPVLDLKPYIPHYDSVPGATLPAWARGGGQGG